MIYNEELHATVNIYHILRPNFIILDLNVYDFGDGFSVKRLQFNHEYFTNNNITSMINIISRSISKASIVYL